jgi:4-hydroxybenzoate polyprenyltransferase
MSIVELLRIRQWYKNLVVFLPIVFGQQMGNLHALLLTCAGFFSLCLASSSNYIINDLVDRKDDKQHPEKRLRPLAAGRVKPAYAIAAALVLMLLSLGIGVLLSWRFFLFVFGLLGLSQLYNFWLKREAFADILVIAINFVLRAVSGAYVIVRSGKPYIWVSPWLILCPFFLSLFISAGKRESDALVLGEKKALHKRVLEVYDREMTKALMHISTTLLIISYGLYSFLSVNPTLMYTLPIALYVIFRYLHLAEMGSVIARHPELAYRDKRLIIGILTWVIMVLVILH